MKKIIIAALVLLVTATAAAQSHISQMFDNVPQALKFNPAQRPVRGFVSFPVIGSIGLGLKLPVSLGDLVYTVDGINYLDAGRISNMLLKNTNNINVSADFDVVNLGFYVTPEDFITINIGAEVNAFATVPTGALDLVYNDAMFGQKSYNISSDIEANSWVEAGIGYSRNFGNFTVGMRARYLSGIVGLSTSAVNNGFQVEQDYDGYLLSGNFALDVVGMPIAPNSKMSFGSNHGVAVDLGVTYLSDDERIFGGFSVGDLGRIWWDKQQVSTINAGTGTEPFKFEGFGDLLDPDIDFDMLLDSIKTAFADALVVDTTYGAQYSAKRLPITLNAVGGYALGDKLQHHVNFAFYGVIPCRTQFMYDISLGYSYHTPNKVWQFMATGTYSSINEWKLGAGVVVNPGCFQFYLGVDNVVGPFRLMNLRDVSLRLGLNFFFGPYSARRKS